jgi:hypothetical protein
MQDDPRAAACFDRALEAFLAQRPDTAAHLAASLAADPGLVVAHVLTGFCRLFAARAALVAEARDALAKAEHALAERGGTARDRALVAALAAWARDGDMRASANRLDALLEQAPRDVLALRLGHALRFMLGDAAGMRAALERALPSWSAEHPAYAYVLGCHAFVLGETGELARAEAVGRQAVALCPADLWGAHAVAHALAGQGRRRAAVAWIGWMEPHMACGGAFVRHIQWHRALDHLALGEGEAALHQYRTLVWRPGFGEVRDVLNAASLLWRLQAAGVVQDPVLWEELADLAEARIGEHAWAFADLHYLLCLAGAGRHDGVAALLASIAAHAGGTQAAVHAEVGLDVAHAIASHDPRETAARLAEAAPRLHRLGGSIAQRALFALMRRKAESMFFFEKKNQKTFSPMHPCLPGSAGANG